MRDRRRIWFAVVGAAVGVAVGILVSVTTDVPLAPEIGSVLGAVAGWFSAGGVPRKLPRGWRPTLRVRFVSDHVDH